MRKKDDKILVVTSEFPPQPGGIGNHAYCLAMSLSKEGYDVEVIADQRLKNNKEEFNFDTVLPFSVIRIKLQDMRLIMYLKRIITTFKHIKGAKYIIATGKFSLWNVAFCSLFVSCKTLAIVHGSEVNFKGSLLRKSINSALKKFDVIIAVSKYTKGLISHLKRDITVIPNGIEVAKWKLGKELTIKLNGNPVLTTVGRVSFRKGQLNVIKQLPELLMHFPELHYHCIGIDTEAEAFIKIANELGVLEHVTFHGSVNEITLKQMLVITDVFVMLSSESVTGDVEGFGIAILEANALGIPAIGSKGCGIEDAINSHVSGVLIEPNNSNAFKNAIEEILQSSDTYSEEAKIWAQSHDWSYIIKRYIDLLA